MSLLGRLEDLPLADIIQIVHLSRRTGVLEIVDGAGKHTVLFRQGLIVNASGPDHPDLITYLRNRGMRMSVMSTDELASAIHERILSVVTPLLQSREGDFNFLLRESLTVDDIEYEPEVVLKSAGFEPQSHFGKDSFAQVNPVTLVFGGSQHELSQG